MGQGGKGLEDELVFDQTILRKQIGHVVHVGHRDRFGDGLARAVGGGPLHLPLLLGKDLLRQGDHGGMLLLVQSQQVAGPGPAQAGQQGGNAQHKGDIDQCAQRAHAAASAAALDGALAGLLTAALRMSRRRAAGLVAIFFL